LAIEIQFTPKNRKKDKPNVNTSWLVKVNANGIKPIRLESKIKKKIE
jgi:hypothetical protein